MNIVTEYNNSYTHKYMLKSHLPIAKHIPSFLNYCDDKGLSEKTNINYESFLKRFLKWLEKENKNNLLPHELTVTDINSYKTYLSSFSGKNGQTLKTITQNYYLIALRALMSYFTVKDIESIPFSKIHLLENKKIRKDINLLDQNQIRQLLTSPSTLNSIGLRDRAILGILIYGGPKVDQLKNLNKNQIEQDEFIPKEVLQMVKAYLRTRDDDCEALFINYRHGKHIHERLTSRSIQRIINYHGKKVKLPFPITPEALRWSRAYALLNKRVEIEKAYSHRIFTIKDYSSTKITSNFIDNPKAIKIPSPTWYIVENIIEKEISWLRSTLSFLPEGYKLNPSFLRCDDCILRKIAILIASGTVKATQFEGKNNEDMWNGLIKEPGLKRLSSHGQEWHKKMMDVVHGYFNSKNYKVVSEPALNYGRADLEVYSNHEKTIVEVGTVSLYKLWYNLSTMKNVNFLIIPSENVIIEFNT